MSAAVDRLVAPLWTSLDLTDAPSDGPVAFHNDLSPECLLSAYRHGLYPFPATSAEQSIIHEITFEADVASGRIQVSGDDPYAVGWWSPDPRPVILIDQVHVQRSLRQQLRNKVEWTTTVDTCFDRVVQHCRGNRETHWLTDELVDTVTALHRAGHAHSVEVWDGDDLIGGAFGTRVGAVFSADSQFTLLSGAGKVAVVDLLRRFAEAGGVAVDVQHNGGHAQLLGAVPIPRSEYLGLLRSHLADTDDLPTARLLARRLAD